MSKSSWFETEDGRLALEAVSDYPEALQVFSEATRDHVKSLQERILNMSLNDPAKDRAFIIAKAELDGAQSVIKYIKQVLDSRGPKKQKRE